MANDVIQIEDESEDLLGLESKFSIIAIWKEHSRGSDFVMLVVFLDSDPLGTSLQMLLLLLTFDAIKKHAKTLSFKGSIILWIIYLTRPPLWWDAVREHHEAPNVLEEACGSCKANVALTNLCNYR